MDVMRPNFREVKHLITAVDGSVVSTLSNVVQAAYLKSSTDGSSKYAYRSHTHFDIERGVPMRIDGTGSAGRAPGETCPPKAWRPARPVDLLERNSLVLDHADTYVYDIQSSIHREATGRIPCQAGPLHTFIAIAITVCSTALAGYRS